MALSPSLACSRLRRHLPRHHHRPPGAGYGPTIKDGLPVVTGQDAEIASVKMIKDGIQQSTIFKDTRTWQPRL